MIPAPGWPAHSADGPPPVEAASPSPFPRQTPGLACLCSRTNYLGVVSRALRPRQDTAHSFNTTALGAGMCVFPYLARSCS